MNISYIPLDVCSRAYNDFSVLYDLRNRQILQLTDVSKDIWDFITSHPECDSDDVIDYIAQLYDCDPVEIREDILSFLNDLYVSGILQLNGKYSASQESCGSPQSENLSDDYEGEIIKYLESQNQIYSATIEMTYACNEQCVHCYAHFPTSDNKASHLNLQQYKSFIDQLYEAGALHLSFTGGDPFVNPFFLEVFRYARERGFVCDIFTNGLFLSCNEKALNDVLNLRPRAFYISLYGANADIHDSVTCVPGSFERTMVTVKKAITKHIPVVFNVMLLSTNYFDAQNIINLATSLGAEYRISMSLVNRNDGSASPMNYFINDKDKIKEVLKIAKSRLYVIDHNSDAAEEKSPFLCGAGVTSVCLSPDGTINPCVSIKYSFGNITEESFETIWNSQNRAKLINSLRWDNTEECVSCPQQSVCLHCPGISQAESGDLFACNKCDKIISQCLFELKNPD